ncbi:MAG: 1,4-dihydroxy-2-naphthoate polyprenyltransferase [Opitutae bacterium]|nr:1,4-dihydroxy-2-naphthoate polyprenyltransferase [Opitutae bacterium]
MKVNPWILAARPRTLPAAMAPVLVATALAHRVGGFDGGSAAICLVFALLLQIATNYANDYFDFKKGADTEARLGPTRAVAAGLIQPEAMKKATGVTFVAALAAGCMLIPYGGWWLLPVGICCLACGYAYTAGPFPLAYIGLGEVFVMLFFGGVAVCFTFFVQTGYFSREALLLATGIGSLSAGLLAINNHRDIETDRLAHKRTLAVRFGPGFSLWEFRILLLWAFAGCLALAHLLKAGWMLLPLLTLPLGYRLWTGLDKASSGREFNKLLANTAALLSLYSVLLALGLIL